MEGKIKKSSTPVICYTSVVAVLERPILPHERPLDYKEFKYLPLLSKNELYSEITVTVYFIFGRRYPDPYSGGTWGILNNDQDKMEAMSFFESSSKIWQRYGKSEEKYRDFVIQKLTEKWIELQGENLTGKILEFD